MASVAPGVRLTALGRGGGLSPDSGSTATTPKRYVMFGMLFWSNQDPDDTKRETPDHTAFVPDAAGKVDMTGYSYCERPDHTNFDGKYGDKTSSAVKQFKVDENLGAQSQGSAGRGVILRLDDLFPP